MGYAVRTPLKFSNIFSLISNVFIIIHENAIRSFVYHTIGFKCNVSTLIW